ncbi:MAG: putative signal transducing protein [Salinibacter sp.]|uniref:putative signal transducing protein n=1 Tax=Salinibacter sp. TaxID=2065818 RepID=UPI0035D4B55D
MTQDPSNALVTVARYDMKGEAQLAKAQLEDAGIPCVLANEEQSGLAMMFDAGRSGVQVKVAADQTDEARAVLDIDP